MFCLSDCEVANVTERRMKAVDGEALHTPAQLLPHRRLIRPSQRGKKKKRLCQSSTGPVHLPLYLPHCRLLSVTWNCCWDCVLSTQLSHKLWGCRGQTHNQPACQRLTSTIRFCWWAPCEASAGWHRPLNLEELPAHVCIGRLNIDHKE